MNNIMTIGGHRAVIQFDPDLGEFRGEFTGLSGGADFYATGVASLRREGAISLRVYLDACKRRGIDPLSKASGALNLRVPAELHRAATAAARASGQSLNQWAHQSVARSCAGLSGRSCAPRQVFDDRSSDRHGPTLLHRHEPDFVPA